MRGVVVTVVLLLRPAAAPARPANLGVLIRPGGQQITEPFLVLPPLVLLRRGTDSSLLVRLELVKQRPPVHDTFGDELLDVRELLELHTRRERLQNPTLTLASPSPSFSPSSPPANHAPSRAQVLIGLEPEQGECLGMVHNEMVVEDHDATLAKAGISGDFLVKGTRAARADAVDKAKSVNLFTKYLVHASGAHGIKCLELVCKYAPERFRERHGKRDFTPLHYAAKRNSPEIGKDFATPLHVAAEYNSTEMAMMLINAGARVNPKDTPRPTPLWWATRNHLTKNHHHDDDEARAKQHPLEQQHDHPQGHVDMVRILEDAGGTGLFLLGESNSAEDSAHVRIM
eukprot:TRINITY_DN11441_c0_g2_i7.p1 TRINITY_DN11441_c0_g2~~TRINITY_DN11441_c0_g2_i7.p1  ORF type:complete len:343 (+),score=67.24 TRINITY_DN11441_c0_g2_i7:108-1136(+)